MEVDAYLAEFTRRDWQTAAEGTVRLAIVGLGQFAVRRALPSIEDSEFCTSTVLVSGSPGKAAEIAAEFDAGEIIDYDAFRDGAAVDAYDAVYIATPPAYHRQHAEIAASHGKHVLCEKPLAASAADAAATIEACDRAGVMLMTAYRLRTEPAIRRVREMIRDGVIGPVVQITGGFTTRLLSHVSADSWRLDPEVAGGGALMDLGVYPLNLSRFLLEREPTAVWGETTSTSDVFDEVEEHASAQLVFPGGATATCHASFNAHPDNRIQVLGTEGQVLIREPFGGDVQQKLVIEGRDAQTEYTGPRVNEVTEEFDYFAHCVLTGADCETDGGDGYRDLQLIEAAYESDATGMRVEV